MLHLDVIDTKMMSTVGRRASKKKRKKKKLTSDL